MVTMMDATSSDWLELKRLEEEQEELWLRAQERQLHHERLTRVQKEVLEQGFVLPEELGPIRSHAPPPPVPGIPVVTAAPPKKETAPLLSSVSVEEEAKLEKWQEIKRRDSEFEEKLMRTMETDEELRREGVEEEVRAELAKALGQQLKEDESRRFEDIRETENLLSNGPDIQRKSMMSHKSQEEEAKLRDWEELKRQESENEERWLRNEERELAQQRQNSRENQENEKGCMRRRVLSNSSTSSGGRRSPIHMQISLEEEMRLKEWEELKRLEEEEEERMLRHMEREMHAQRLKAEEIERRKFQEAIERQNAEEELRMLNEKQKQMSGRKLKSPGKKTIGKGVDTQAEWERIRRQQEETEEQMRLLTERELEKQKLAQEIQRKMRELSESKLSAEKRKIIESNPIIEEEDDDEEEGENSWEEIQRKQEEEEERIRTEQEREKQRRHPTLRQQESEERLKEIKRNRELRQSISEESEEDSEVTRLNAVMKAETERLKEIRDKQAKLDNQIRAERAKLADLERMEIEETKQSSEAIASENANLKEGCEADKPFSTEGNDLSGGLQPQNALLTPPNSPFRLEENPKSGFEAEEPVRQDQKNRPSDS